MIYWHIIKTLDLYCDYTDKMRIMFAVKFGLTLKIKNVKKIMQSGDSVCRLF